MQNLKLAEDAVLKVKYLLPYGAGNQKTDISYTQGESWARRAMLRDNEYNQDPIQNAGRAVAYQAGNWNEHANVGYTLLAASSLNAPLCSRRYLLTFSVDTGLTLASAAVALASG